jgi:hypothetical protein
VTTYTHLVLIYHMVREALLHHELWALFRRHFSRNRLVTPVAMDLSGPIPEAPLPPGSDLRFVELRPEDIKAGIWTFSVPSRRYKALLKTESGFRGFALAHGNTIVADTWCAMPRGGKCASHPDLKMLAITCREGEAYGFDMLIDPDYRGKNLAVPLQRALHHVLKREGCLTKYGSYYDDNLPAMWMHRMLKYRELPKRRVSRFLVYSSSEPAEKTNVNTQQCAPGPNKS